MSTAPTVRPLGPHERREAVAVLARAFWHDPLFDAFARDLLHEHQLLPVFFQAVLGDVLRAGRVWVAEDAGRPRGIAGWLPPGAYPRSRRNDALLQAQALRAIARSKQRAMAVKLLSEIDAQHPHEPHWYLAILGVDPGCQGRGLGGALLRPVLAECDEQGIPAYLETQKESNLAYYGRFGFASVNEIRLPGAPPLWCMRREPA